MTFDKDKGIMYGRGTTDDKGPIMGWLNVLEAHHTLGLELPVNLVFCFEGMEESGSEGLDDFIASESKKGNDGWFGGVDAVCIVCVHVTFVLLRILNRLPFSQTTTGLMTAHLHLPTVCAESRTSASMSRDQVPTFIQGFSVAPYTSP